MNKKRAKKDDESVLDMDEEGHWWFCLIFSKLIF